MPVKVPKYENLPFEEGKTYQTAFQTKDRYIIKKIIWRVEQKVTKKIVGFEGIYEKYPHLGTCPLPVDRLIPEKKFVGEIEVCEKCKEPV